MILKSRKLQAIIIIFIIIMIKIEEEAMPTQKQQAKNDQITYRKVQHQKSKKANLKSKKKAKSQSRWNSSEDIRYLKFLKTKSHCFDLPLGERQRMKINCKISKRVQSRTSSQCRSHHQKMMVRYGTVSNIIANLSKRYRIVISQHQKNNIQLMVKLQTKELFQEKNVSNTDSKDFVLTDLIDCKIEGKDVEYVKFH